MIYHNDKTNTVSIWLLALVVALLMSCSYMLDGPDDIQVERDIQTQISNTAKALQLAHGGK